MGLLVILRMKLGELVAVIIISVADLRNSTISVLVLVWARVMVMGRRLVLALV